jgi:hypothetical protein
MVHLHLSLDGVDRAVADERDVAALEVVLDTGIPMIGRSIQPAMSWSFGLSSSYRKTKVALMRVSPPISGIPSGTWTPAAAWKGDVARLYWNSASSVNVPSRKEPFTDAE